MAFKMYSACYRSFISSASSLRAQWPQQRPRCARPRVNFASAPPRGRKTANSIRCALLSAASRLACASQLAHGLSPPRRPALPASAAPIAVPRRSRKAPKRPLEPRAFSAPPRTQSFAVPEGRPTAAAASRQPPRRDLRAGSLEQWERQSRGEPRATVKRQLRSARAEWCFQTRSRQRPPTRLPARNRAYSRTAWNNTYQHSG